MDTAGNTGGGRGGAGSAGQPPGGRAGANVGGRSSGGGSDSGRTGTAGIRDETAGDSGAGGAGGAETTDYDAAVLADGPVMYLTMSGETNEPDRSGNGHDGSYRGGAPARAPLPNGDRAAGFDGVKQYLTVPSAAALSIPTTHELTWEAWIRPDVLQFPHATNGYVDWMGKCEEYAPTCEWEARLYSLTNSEDRCNRLSAYAFNPDGDLGSGAFWQQADCGVSIVAGDWYQVVGEYTTLAQPASCSETGSYPGVIEIWVNGVRWNQASHGQTGCMSQYQVVPVANDSPLNVGTMAHDAWFAGAVGKLAIYDKLLGADAIARHYQVMTGRQPTGSCADTCSF
ncbi:MAG TPA: LamG-like jellyroll fold domain-containing protein [Polyangiaceae bacterium]|nr:LamG-like jellyroll fold domain-containing protein [Polyangiaceae bacterium]